MALENNFYHQGIQAGKSSRKIVQELSDKISMEIEQERTENAKGGFLAMIAFTTAFVGTGMGISYVVKHGDEILESCVRAYSSLFF